MEGNIHILMTTDTIGGVWTYSLSLCKALQPYDIFIHLAAMGGLASEAQKRDIQALRNVVLYESDYKLEWMENPWEDVANAHHWLHSLYLRVQPDVVHLNNFARIHPGWNCPVITVFHSCVATWWQAVKQENIPGHWQPYLQLLRETTAASDVVVAPSHAMLQQALKIHKIATPSRVIYNASASHPAPKVKKENFILATGRIWDEAKNLQLLEAIASELPWPVYIAGNNRDPNTEKALKLKNVRLLGQLSSGELKQWMQRAAIFVSPAHYEPFGLAILEAAKACCALALSGIDSLKEIWQENAIYFDPKDQKDVHNTLKNLIADEEKRLFLAKNGQKQAQNYSLSKKGKAYANLYQQVLNNQQKNQKINSL